jgi:hypothetical protein
MAMLPSFAGSAISLSRVAITASIRLGLTLPQQVADAQLSSAWHQGRGSRHKACPDRALELHDLHRTVATGLQRLRTRLEVAEAVPTTSAAAAPASREVDMNVPRQLLLMVTLATSVSTASGQQVTLTASPSNPGARTAASIPDFPRYGVIETFPGEDALAEALGEVLMLVLGFGELDSSRTEASRALSAALR